MEYYYWTLFNHGSNFSSCSSGTNTTTTTTETTTQNGNFSSIHPCQHHSTSDVAPPNSNSNSNSTYTYNPQSSSASASAAADPLTTLKLGKRHYPQNEDQDPPNKKKSKPQYSEGAPRCQVEGCGTTLVNAKEYHRRHKVCQTHAKSPNVIVHGIRQRFCQQCSRFHSVGEFDDTKRSCRRRLAGHNERRRKSSQDHFNSRPQTAAAAGNRLLRHTDSLHTTRHCALSLLSSYDHPNHTNNSNNLPHSSSDLPARCSAALRELIAGNRACQQLTQIDDRDCYTTYNYKLGSFVRAAGWNPGGHVTTTTLAHNSGFGLFPSVNDADKNPSPSRDDEAAGCSEFWKSMEF